MKTGASGSAAEFLDGDDVGRDSRRRLPSNGDAVEAEIAESFFHRSIRGVGRIDLGSAGRFRRRQRRQLLRSMSMVSP
jgi:hypothetical protein